jgi:porin
MIARQRSIGADDMGGWRTTLRVLLAGLVAATAALALPAAARADAECGVTDSGIPDGVFTPIDVAHMRKSLADVGIGLGGSYVGEAFTNTGGIEQGGKYDGLLTLYLNADLKKMGLWKGLCLSTSAFQIHGNSITADNIGSLMPVSNLEATPATRLFELWVEQHMFNDVLAVKVGQLAADQEFILSNSYSYFLNGTWGWPSIAAADLPGGGPAYPLATPGVRVAIRPSDDLKLMIGVYNGDPANPNCANENPQVCNSDGLDFNLDSPALLMVEGSYKYNRTGQLPGTVKVGGWNHFGTFPNERLDSDDLPIAATLNRGRPIDGDWGIYGIIDQLVWRLPGSEDTKGVGLFGRIMGAPSAQNLVNFYAEAGITFSGMIPHRADDSLGIGLAYTGVSDQVHGFDIDSGLPAARTSEAVLEICYTAQLKPGWTLQPDFQYFWQPGGNVPDASGSGAVENAAVFGARTTLNF